MKTLKLKSMDLVYVTWEDAYSSAGWQPDPHKHNPALVASVGFVVFADKRGIKLACGGGPDISTRDSGDEPLGWNALGAMFIPNGMIRKVTKMKVPK